MFHDAQHNAVRRRFHPVFHGGGCFSESDLFLKHNGHGDHRGQGAKENPLRLGGGEERETEGAGKGG